MVITSPLIVSCRFVYKLARKVLPCSHAASVCCPLFTLYSLVQLFSLHSPFTSLKRFSDTEHRSSSFIYYYIRWLFNIRPPCFPFVASSEHSPPPSIPRWLYSICGRKSTRCWSSTTTLWPWRCLSCGQDRWCPLPGPTPQTQRSSFSFSRHPSLTAGQPLHLFHCDVRG